MAKRRGAGEGSVYRRADGRWCAYLNLGVEAGKRRRRYFYGQTQKQVQDSLLAARRDLAAGVVVTPERQTVEQFLTRWLEDVAKLRVKPATYAMYTSIAKKHLYPRLGRHLLAKLTPQQVQGWIAEQTQAGAAPKSVRIRHGVLLSALAQAVEWGLIARNPAASATLPKPSAKAMRALTPEELTAFLAAIRGHRYESLLLVTLALGLRRGEVLGLRWADVDLKGGTVQVRQQVKRTTADGGLHTAALKTEQSRRTLVMPEVAARAFRTRKAQQIQERLLAGERWKDTGLVFTTAFGTAIDPTNLSTAFARLLKAHDLPHRRLHDLRHSCATFLLSQGVPAQVVQKILGHANVSTTLGVYSHVLHGMEEAAAVAMDHVLKVI